MFMRTYTKREIEKGIYGGIAAFVFVAVIAVTLLSALGVLKA